MRDMHSNMKVVEALRAATRTADANGLDVNVQGYESVELVVAVGLSGDTLAAGLNISIELEESDDNGSGAPAGYTDVAATDIVGGNGGASGQAILVNDPAEDETVYRFGYIGTKKWVRVVYNITGTHTNGCPCAVVAVLMNPRHAPVADQKV